jgi:hypothetical protein
MRVSKIHPMFAGALGVLFEIFLLVNTLPMLHVGLVYKAVAVIMGLFDLSSFRAFLSQFACGFPRLRNCFGEMD